MREHPDGAIPVSGLHAIAKATLLELLELRQENYLLHDRVNQATKNELAALRLPPRSRKQSAMRRSFPSIHGFGRTGNPGSDTPQRTQSPWARQADSPLSAKSAHTFDCRAEFASTTAAELGRSAFTQSHNNSHGSRRGFMHVPSAATSRPAVDGMHVNGLQLPRGPHDFGTADSDSTNTPPLSRLQSPLHGEHLWSGPVLLSTTGQLMPGGSALAALL
jgi:hypothetical protein